AAGSRFLPATKGSASAPIVAPKAADQTVPVFKGRTENPAPAVRREEPVRSTTTPSVSQPARTVTPPVTSPRKVGSLAAAPSSPVQSATPPPSSAPASTRSERPTLLPPVSQRLGVAQPQPVNPNPAAPAPV